MCNDVTNQCIPCSSQSDCDFWQSCTNGGCANIPCKEASDCEYNLCAQYGSEDAFCYYCESAKTCEYDVEFEWGDWAACKALTDVPVGKHTGDFAEDGACTFKKSDVSNLSGGAIFGIIFGGLVGLGLFGGAGFMIGKKMGGSSGGMSGGHDVLYD